MSSVVFFEPFDMFFSYRQISRYKFKAFPQINDFLFKGFVFALQMQNPLCEFLFFCSLRNVLSYKKVEGYYQNRAY